MLKDQKSELLLPVGDIKMCLAAIHNGADAIYLGVPHFNARGRTTDFNETQLKEIIDTAHLYGVKVNLAFNVVIFEEEILLVIQTLKDVLKLGVDALIIQDLGLAALVRHMAPSQIIHGSTQMTITNFEAMELLSDLKIKRFVLGREVSLSEMRAIKEKTKNELEVFVHGALCVAYSGQCFTSESIGGRSANRGQCAQSCRLEYEMFVDGVKKDTNGIKYLVSPKDLCGIAEIPELLKMGIHSFKVEGRLKSPEYVAATAKNYRQAIDCNLSEEEMAKMKLEMGVTYSRGFYSGWLHGVDHQNLVDGTFSSHRGVLIGTVLKIKNKSIFIKTSYSNLKNGDGLLFSNTTNHKKKEIGGKIYHVKKEAEGVYELIFSKDFEIKKVHVDSLVYLNHDALLFKNLAQTFTDKQLKKKIPLNFKIEGEVGGPLKVITTDGEIEKTFFSKENLLPAISEPIQRDDIVEIFKGLSATCFKLNKLTFHSSSSFFIHHKLLKKMRNEISDYYTLARVRREDIVINEYINFSKKEKNEKKPAKLNLVLREMSQVKSLLTFFQEIGDFLGVVYLDYEFGREYEKSVLMLREKGMRVGIATTRILKPNEYHNFKIIEKAKPDVILCRNLGAVYYFQNKNFELRGDFSLNVTNSLTANYLLKKKLQTLCASYDLSSKQLLNLVQNVESERIEVTIHQYMPSFHMEHCVFAAFMSKGSSFKDCGKPCEKHRLELKDQFGNYHQIKADQECRNTMFNAIPQSAAKFIPALLEKGVTDFRFEALYENELELSKKILLYKKLIENKQELQNIEMIKEIGVFEKYGLSDGTQHETEYKNRKN